jgi:uncharacterized protein YheU (UPF0270 family)
MYLIKDNKIVGFTIIQDKVLTTIELNGKWISNPTLEQMHNDGWEDYTINLIDELPSLESLVESALREGIDGGSPLYTLNQELKVQRERDENPEQFMVYNNRVKECIVWAHTQPHQL